MKKQKAIMRNIRIQSGALHFSMSTIEDVFLLPRKSETIISPVKIPKNVNPLHFVKCVFSLLMIELILIKRSTSGIDGSKGTLS
jgi:hypothetical protein